MAHFRNFRKLGTFFARRRASEGGKKLMQQPRAVIGGQVPSNRLYYLSWRESTAMGGCSCRLCSDRFLPQEWSLPGFILFATTK